MCLIINDVAARIAEMRTSEYSKKERMKEEV